MMQTLVQINSGIRYEDIRVCGTDRMRRVERYHVLEGRLAESGRNRHRDRPDAFMTCLREPTRLVSAVPP